MSFKPKDPSRRQFLSQAAKAATAASTIGVLGGIARTVRADEREEFEFIVVGSGAGGGPVAANLARAGFKVLVLEAGGAERHIEAQVPAFHPLSTEKRGMAWNFYVNHYSDPAKQAQDPKHVPGRGILYPRAGTLGGCTTHNALITLYPDNRDWQEIADLTGDRGWSPEAMREQFRRVERNRYLPSSTVRDGQYGSDGWLTTEINDLKLLAKDVRVLPILLSAAQECGISADLFQKLIEQDGNFAFDPNHWSYIRNKVSGLFNIPKASDRGRRRGTRELLLETQAKYPKNLTIRTHALVSHLIFSDLDRTQVIGVEYLEGSHLYDADPMADTLHRALSTRKRVFAAKEVILCGGTFNTPQTLMLSGIGPAEEVRRVGISPRMDLPGVGRNLQDRYEVCVTSKLRFDLQFLDGCKPLAGEGTDPCLEDYKRSPESSPYASNGILIALLKHSTQSMGDPDLAIFGVPGHFQGYKPGYSRESFQRDEFTWAVLKGHNRNRSGRVTLRTGSPLDTPQIDFNSFDRVLDPHNRDLRAMVEGIKTARNIMDRFGASLTVKEEVAPGRALESDADLEGFVMREQWGHHASCTAAIGADGDRNSVLDGKFRVRGIKNLRVVDASIFPRTPGLFIVLPIYMAAEKASEDIVRDWA